MGKVVGLTFKAPKAKFICPECGNEYASEATLNKHIKEKHSATPPVNPPNTDNGGGGA